MNENPVVVWFRQDLRLRDNPALSAAVERGAVLPVYILDDSVDTGADAGSASHWWLHHSLQSLSASLGGQLVVIKGKALELLPKLAREVNVQAVYWNRCYEPEVIERDKIIKGQLSSDNVEVRSFNSARLWEPWQVLKKDGTPYRIFTPFYRKGCLQQSPPREPLPVPKSSRWFHSKKYNTDINDLGLLPAIKWYPKLESHWEIGETAAHRRLAEFIDDGLEDYHQGRDFPASGRVSRLSPHLHFGEISPNSIWHAVSAAGVSARWENDLDHFLSELGWREFAAYLLYYFPSLTTDNLQARFDKFKWLDQPKKLHAWQRGQTGFPLIDAGMRELWETGFMHNRVRMLTASFLTKNLMIHWHAGQAWFRDCLVDADLASNSVSWQWVAGTGVDAAPYFRIFNPITQSEKFDPNGDYIRRFMPEIKNLPNKYLHNPSSAPEEVLREAGVAIGVNYPAPIVDLKMSRQRALEAFAAIR